MSDGETKLLLWPDGGGGKAGEGKGTAAPHPAMCHYLSPEPQTDDGKTSFRSPKTGFAITVIMKSL